MRPTFSVCVGRMYVTTFNINVLTSKFGKFNYCIKADDYSNNMVTRFNKVY